MLNLKNIKIIRFTRQNISALKYCINLYPGLGSYFIFIVDFKFLF